MSVFSSTSGSLRQPVNRSGQAGVPDLRTSVSVKETIRGANRRFFTHRTYLAALGVKDVVTLDHGETVPALFATAGGGLKHLGRLAELDALTVSNLSRSLFERTASQFVVFEDIVLKPGGGRIGFPGLSFRFQSNWRRSLAPGERYLSNRQSSGLRRKIKKLKEAVKGEALEFRFERCTPGHVDAITALNQRKIKASGGRYHLDPARYQALKTYLSECGFCACLHAGDRLIAGDIISVTGHDAYFHIVGYDATFERYSPGMQVHIAAMEKLTEMGCRRANFLWGNRRWKSDLGGVGMPLVTIIVARSIWGFAHPGLWVAALPFATTTLRRWVKTLIFRGAGS